MHSESTTTITVVTVIALTILLLQSAFAVVTITLRGPLTAARAALDAPALTCDQLEDHTPFQETYAQRPLQTAIIDGSFLWVALMIPFNVAAFTVIAPQLNPPPLRRAFVLGMAFSLIVVLANMNAIGLTRCALAG